MKNYGRILQDKDVITKEYLEKNFGNSDYLPLSGGNLTGVLGLPELCVLDTDGNAQGRLQLGEEAETLEFLVGRNFSIKNDYGASIELQGSTLMIDGGAALQLKSVMSPTNDLDAANKSYVDSCRPKYRTITLPVASWVNNSISVACVGVTANEYQMITPVPASDSQDDYIAAGVVCTGQALNIITFSCLTTPTTNLTVHIVMQDLVQLT